MFERDTSQRSVWPTRNDDFRSLVLPPSEARAIEREVAMCCREIVDPRTDPDLRCERFRELQRLGRSGPLSNRLQDHVVDSVERVLGQRLPENDHVRLAAIETLGQIGTTGRVVSILARSSGLSSPSVERDYALHALTVRLDRENPPNRQIQELLATAASNAQNPQRQETAIRMLSQTNKFPEETARLFLTIAATDPSPGTRVRAGEGLINLPPEAVTDRETIVALLSSDHDGMRRTICRALQRQNITQSPEVSACLSRVAELDANPEVRARAIGALGRRFPEFPGLQGTLVHALDSKDPHLEAAAITATRRLAERGLPLEESLFQSLRRASARLPDNLDAFAALGFFPAHREEVAREAMTRLSSRDAEIALGGVRAIANLPGDRSAFVTPLDRLLRRQDIRHSDVLQSLASIGRTNDRALQILTNAVLDPALSESSLNALSSLGRRAAPVLPILDARITVLERQVANGADGHETNVPLRRLRYQADLIRGTRSAAESRRQNGILSVDSDD